MRRRLLPILLLGAAVHPASLNAQFSSDIPGTPRAATPFGGRTQTRTEFDFSYFRFEGNPAGDSLQFGARIGLGKSWRIQTNWEVGLDLTLLEGSHLRPPNPEDVGETDRLRSHTRGLLGYGLRVGGKFRPLVSVTPEGYGYHAAVGIAYQPAVKPLFAVTFEKDSTQTGGVFVNDEPSIVGSVPSSLQLAFMGSYRARRVMLDGAVLIENSEPGPLADGPTPTQVYDGVSLRVGAVYRLLRNVSAGAVYWGDGAAPWRDRVVLRSSSADASYGFLLSFGSRPEAGTDLMITSPTGEFGESVRLYIRTRSTR